jgi:preprotein translocase subunit SecE
MSMNREQKRLAKKRGDVDSDGEPTTTKQSRRAAPPPAKTKEDRTSARQFLREVRQELRKVAWPSRAETINFSVVVFIALVVMTLMIFALDWVFARGVLRLFGI